jgi:hypothetical protein
MAAITRSKILVLFLVLSHLLGFRLHYAFHKDLIVISGLLGQQILPHGDADHCKHIPLSEYIECNICLSSQNSIVPVQISPNPGKVQVVGAAAIISSQLLVQEHLFESFSRRGPPSLLG